MSAADLLLAEVTKLRRSLVALLLLGIPAVVCILLVAVMLSGNGPKDWQHLAMQGTAIWAYFLLPMTATAFTALQAQIEHAPRAWSHALASPHASAWVFAAKAAIAVGAMAVIGTLVGLAIILGGLVAGGLLPADALAGELPVDLLASLLGRMWAASLLLIAIQFTLAMAVPSFAAPVVVGIAGTFIAIVAMSARAGVYFPWLMPINMLASSPERAELALAVGFWGGLVFFAISCWWLGRRDWH